MNKEESPSKPNLSILIAQFYYGDGCLIKLPVAVKEKEGKYFMKNPVKPNPEWEINFLTIRSIDFPENHSVQLYTGPNESNYWDTKVLKKISHNEQFEIYEITKPIKRIIYNRRQNKRFFFLTPIKCYINNQIEAVNATCLDLSNEGIAIKFAGKKVFPDNQKILIEFEKPFEDFPKLLGKLIRQSFNKLDQSTSVILLIEHDYKGKLLEIMKKAGEQKQQDAFNLNENEEKSRNTKNNNDSSELPQRLFNQYI